jgi:UDP-glucose 4-epimerase
VYGTPYTGHITELTPPNPQQPYAKTHLAAEELLAQAHETGQLSTIRLRLSNGFGYPMIRDNAIWQIVINDLCRQAVVHGSLSLKSPGLQQRNFIPFTDVCTALIHAIELDDKQVGDGLFNLGSNAAMRVVDIAERVQERARVVLGIDLSLAVPPATDDNDAPSLNYDSSKIRATGLHLSDDLNAEIDALLRYCARTFGTSA